MIINCSVHNSLPRIPFLRQINPMKAANPIYPFIHFITLLLPTYMSYECSSHSKLCSQTFLLVSYLPLRPACFVHFILLHSFILIIYSSLQGGLSVTLSWWDGFACLCEHESFVFGGCSSRRSNWADKIEGERPEKVGLINLSRGLVWYPPPLELHCEMFVAYPEDSIHYSEKIKGQWKPIKG